MGDVLKMPKPKMVLGEGARSYTRRERIFLSVDPKPMMRRWWMQMVACNC